MIASNWEYDFNVITSNLVLSKLCNNRWLSDKLIWNIPVPPFLQWTDIISILNWTCKKHILLGLH